MVILQFYTPKQRPTCRKLAEQFKDTPGVRLDDGFDGYETIFFFPVALFEQVAEAVGARKRRVLSHEHKERLAEASQAYRFKPKFDGSKDRQNPPNEAIPTQAREYKAGEGRGQVVRLPPHPRQIDVFCHFAFYFENCVFLQHPSPLIHTFSVFFHQDHRECYLLTGLYYGSFIV